MILSFLSWLGLAFACEVPRYVEVIAEQMDELRSKDDGCVVVTVGADEARFIQGVRATTITADSFVDLTILPQLPRHREPPSWLLTRSIRPRATLPAAPALRRWRPMRWSTNGLMRPQRGARVVPGRKAGRYVEALRWAGE